MVQISPLQCPKIWEVTTFVQFTCEHSFCWLTWAFRKHHTSISVGWLCKIWWLTIGFDLLSSSCSQAPFPFELSTFIRYTTTSPTLNMVAFLAALYLRATWSLAFLRFQMPSAQKPFSSSRSLEAFTSAKSHIAWLILSPETTSLDKIYYRGKMYWKRTLVNADAHTAKEPWGGRVYWST